MTIKELIIGIITAIAIIDILLFMGCAELERRNHMPCKYKEFFGKADTDCYTRKCDRCWLKEKYDDLANEAMESDRKESEEWEQTN